MWNEGRGESEGNGEMNHGKHGIPWKNREFCHKGSEDVSDSRKKQLQIRNSTAEFLIFTARSGEESIEVRYEDETIWLTQKLMATLFDVTVPTISEHLANIYDQGEISREATVRKFRTVQKEGSRDVTRSVAFYNLDDIISVGYRVNSVRATQFRQWATHVRRKYAIKGYVLDRKRLENGAFLGEVGILS